MSGFDWSRYHSHMRFSDDQLRTRLHYYLRYFQPGQRALDVGCGHGVFLELLKQHGVDAIGVDLDPEQVRRCREKGLDARVADAGEFLASSGEEFDGVFASHLVEHLAADVAAELVAAASKSLLPGGLLILLTPNPESLHVHLLEFWRDPTHVRMYSKEVLTFFMSEAGLDIVEATFHPGHNTGRERMHFALHPGKWWTRLLMKPVTGRIDRVLGPLGLDQGNELYVVGRRPPLG